MGSVDLSVEQLLIALTRLRGENSLQVDWIDDENFRSECWMTAVRFG